MGLIKYVSAKDKRLSAGNLNTCFQLVNALYNINFNPKHFLVFKSPTGIAISAKGFTSGSSTEDETKLSFGITDSATSTSITAGNVRFSDKTIQLSTTVVSLTGDPCYTYVKVDINTKMAVIYTDASYLDNTASYMYFPLAKYESTGYAYTRTMRYHRGGDITVGAYIT